MGGWLLPGTWGDDWSGTAGVPPSQETMGEAACRMASYLTVPSLILASSTLL